VSLAAGSYTPDLFEREALEFIRREGAKPFFLFLAATLPHANNELTRRTGNGMEIASDTPYSAENWTPQQRNYAAMVSRLDATVGAVLAELRAQKIDRQTLVLFTSDNGPQGVGEGGYDQSLFRSNGGFRGIKRELYEGGIRVPLIAWWPGKVRANTTDATPWAQYDLLATLAAVGLVNAPKTDGRSYERVLRGRKMKAAPFLYFEFHEGGFVRAVRAGKWKAVMKGKDGAVELYDLARDPRESRDVAAQNPKMAAELRAAMLREHVESDDWRDR
jgi:arylsulfatase A-like enzyme